MYTVMQSNGHGEVQSSLLPGESSAPGIGFISKLIPGVRLRVLHELLPNGIVIRDQLCTFINSAQSHSQRPLVPAPGSSGNTHGVPSACLWSWAWGLFPSSLGCWILHSSYKGWAASRPHKNVNSSCPWSYGHGELVLMHISTSPGPPQPCLWGRMGSPAQAVLMLLGSDPHSSTSSVTGVVQGRVSLVWWLSSASGALRMVWGTWGSAQTQPPLHWRS